MAKDLKEGDEITLRFEVRRVWEDGKVSLSNPLYPSRITINANEIPDEDVIRDGGKKRPEPEQTVHYAVKVGRQIVLSTHDRDEAYTFAERLDNGRVQETPQRPRKKR
jgi:hypothetical protein